MKRRGRPLIVVLLGVAAGIAILGATQQPASASFGSLETGDFLLTVGNANVRHVRPGAVDEVVSDGAPAPSTQYGLCLDSANNIYVTNYEANTVTKLDPAGNILANPWVSFGGKSLNPTSCTVDSSGDVYVGMGSVVSPGAARLLRFNPDGTPDPTHPSYTLAAPTPTSEIWVDLMHGDECIAAYSAGDDLIREWNVCTDTALTTRFQRGSGTSSACHGVRFTPVPFDHLLAACDDHAYKWDPSDTPDSFGNIQPIAPPGTGTYDNPNPASTKFYDVDTDPSGAGDTFWVTAADASSSTNEVLQFTYSSSTHIGGVTVGVSPAVRGIAVVQSCVCPTPTSTPTSTSTSTSTSTPGPPSGGSFASSTGTASPTFFFPFTPFVGGFSTPFFPPPFPNFQQPFLPFPTPVTWAPFTTPMTWAPFTTPVTWAPMAAPAVSPPAPASAATPPPAEAVSPPAAAPPPARTTPPPSPAPPTALPPVPPPSVLPLDITASPVVARTLVLSLSRNSAEPGGDVTATGEGCDANSPVWLELDGRPVGSTAADGAGHFRAPLDLKNTSIGDYDVLAHCGPTLQTRLAVTQTQKLDQPLSSILMLLFVLLGGAVVVRSALGVG